MKAIRFHSFGEASVLRLEETSDPIAGPGQVVLRAKAVGVNPVDVYIRAGKYGPRPFPHTPGFDAAGMVESVGTGVVNVKVGDRAYSYGSISGTYAERVLCEANQVHPLPDSLSFSQGAGLGLPYFTACYALQKRANAQPGENVLVHGASGGVGTAAIQIGRMMGLTMFGTAGSAEGLAHVKRQGAAYAMDHHQPDYLEKLVALTDKRGLDLILEMLANVNLAKDLKVLSKRGRVVVIGSRSTVEIDPRDTMGRNASILGMSMFNATPEELSSVAQVIDAGAEQGLLIPTIGKEFPLADAAQAHNAIMAAGALGKIILVP